MKARSKPVSLTSSGDSPNDLGAMEGNIMAFLESEKVYNVMLSDYLKELGMYLERKRYAASHLS